MNNEFKTKVNLDISLDRAGNYDIVTENMNLRWNLELEVRQYGIKSFIITVPDQQITVSLNIWGDENDTEEELTLDIKDVIIEKSEFSDSLIPHGLEFYKGKWKLVF